MKTLNFIFLIGAPRSGTTWLQALLASHPKIITGQETHFFSGIKKFLDFYDNRDDWRKVGLDVYWPNEKKYELVRFYFLKFIESILEETEQKFYFLEKTPEHALCMPLIYKCFPEAKFIHIIRDPRHMVASLMRIFKKNNRYISATTASIIWRDFVYTARNFGKKIPNDNYFELKYEDLRVNTHKLLCNLFSWLGLPYDDKQIKKIIEDCSLSQVKKRGKFQTIRSETSEPNGFFASGSIGKNVSLSKLELFRVYEICGSLMQELGYVDETPRTPFWIKIAYSYKIRKIVRLREI